ncbi:FAD binding domain protein [Aspergillus fischeri NRRL 181]|uniref:FAD binding domain protein n=1 Tax=Neosartorya fischeri (strain ATCC 1020 / DSM 3700 / CBS 544.65 / FGSC A1164 / JCM 1740 / NRRL 181 / WB 181) TaxID=331117 RepID=A1CVG4_NEOFI|nr:FAD binding domain protein [Aspergillus fischeri NRRL 181]EAW25741.1 FAD binding domain protein [Aspergillus fischeri NRRL 181]
MLALGNPIDVLIVGALGINFRIIDKRSDEPRVGQADGLNPKTMEIFEAWQIHDRVTKLWEPATHLTMWCRRQDGKLIRTTRQPSQPTPGGTVEEIIKKRLVEISSASIEYHTSLCELSIDSKQLVSPAAYPCTAQLQRLQGENTPNEMVSAKYVIGADGAKSLTRESLDISMQGVKGTSIWGVMDFAGSSDFPDFGATSIIRSDTDGAIDFVPREKGLVRMYVQLNKGQAWEGLRRADITPELIIEKCRFIIRPYKVRDRSSMWSAFTASQKLSSSLSKHQRVFLVGDAIHTHSPVTGMGMNTSIQDSYNLAWKLAGVIKGHLESAILTTYDTERGAVARQLLEADRTTLELFNTRSGFESSILLGRLNDVRIFLGGRGIRYTDKLLTSTAAQGIGLFAAGECLPELSITHHTTGRSLYLNSALKADGSWNVIVFAGDVSLPDQMRRIHKLAKVLEKTQSVMFGQQHAIIVHCAHWEEVELAQLPEFFSPCPQRSARDYTAIYLDEGSAYDQTRLNRNDGGLVLVRPDRHIAWAGGLEFAGDLEVFVSSVFQTADKA